MIITKEQYEEFYLSQKLPAGYEPMEYKDYLLKEHAKLSKSSEPSAEALLEAIEQALESL